MSAAAPPTRIRYRRGGVGSKAVHEHAEADDNAAEQMRASRKRAQNRLSQRCAREKKRLVEQRKRLALVDDNRTADTDGEVIAGDTERFRAAYVDVVRENEELTAALLTTRKKLLSLSTAAAAAAEHPVFRRILGHAATEQDPTTVDDDAPSVTGQSGDRDVVEDLEGSAPSAPASFDLCPGDQESNQQAHLAGDGPTTPLSRDLPSASTSGTQAALPSVAIGNVERQDAPPADKGWNMDMLDDWTGFGDIFDTTEWPLKDCPSNVIDRLEETMLLYISHRFEMHDVSNLTAQTVIQVAARARAIRFSLRDADALQVHQVVEEAAAVCVVLQVNWACMGSYIFGVGAHVAMQHVMRWRLAPSPANRACIPAPFCPTPLQYTSLSHSPVIDCVNWPTIRDQLILHHGKYDLDLLIKDVVHGTVIDIASAGSSFNIRDMFMTHVDGSNAESTQGDASDALNGEATDRSLPLPRSRAELLSHVVEAMRKEAARKASRARSPWEEREPRDLKAVTPRTHEKCHRYGLDNMLEWKLSGKFAAKYPWLDCSGG